jgi:S1-C subfamily serine protease
MATAPQVAIADPPADPSRSIVKVLATQRRPDLFRPWTHQAPRDVNGSGVVIKGNRILTNAQVVKYSSRVLVEPNLSGEKLAATVEFLADDIDLAILKLEDPTFFETHPPLPTRQELPKIKDVVLACGYPVGGDNLSVTRGIVSRIEFEEYYYSSMGLRIQVDAAINSGNSGGPALIEDKMIGIIFNRLEEADNIGYIIPIEEIDLFLGDIADGRYDGKPHLFDYLEPLENPAIRKALKLPRDLNGMVDSRPAVVDPPSGLKPMDVITAIGDEPIDIAGKIRVAEDLRVDFRYQVQKLAKEGKVPAKVFREGQPMDLMLTVPTSGSRKLILPELRGGEISYLVWGPLTFAAATDDYLNEFDREGMAARWYPYLTYHRNPMLGRRGDVPRFDGEQIVVAVAMFPHRISKGYPNPSSYVVDTVDGTKVRNLRHLGELLLGAKGTLTSIRFQDVTSGVLVFDRKEVLDSAEEILNENGIRFPCSADLKDLLQAPR